MTEIGQTQEQICLGRQGGCFPHGHYCVSSIKQQGCALGSAGPGNRNQIRCFSNEINLGALGVARQQYLLAQNPVLSPNGRYPTIGGHIAGLVKPQAPLSAPGEQKTVVPIPVREGVAVFRMPHNLDGHVGQRIAIDIPDVTGYPRCLAVSKRIGRDIFLTGRIGFDQKTVGIEIAGKRQRLQYRYR